ncbi:hypothetical protein WG66_009695 [Moniliophthora roreri]|uniref:F-box domain-containing protein n=1 Tax=Moniliophthora roreri TaxID=221103 RepID=A0A0W0FLW2_MONRR|nr:hypothetical protein WG66_009695 [Moniliophthora roreri]
MPPFIAPELILCMLQHLPPWSFDNLDNCALVCRSWTPHARSIIFREIRLSSAERIIKLIDLLTSPHETIAAAIKYINIEEGWFGDVFLRLGDGRLMKPDAGKILEALTRASERSLSCPKGVHGPQPFPIIGSASFVVMFLRDICSVLGTDSFVSAIGDLSPRRMGPYPVQIGGLIIEAWEDAAVFNALLLESGESLEELEFIVDGRRNSVFAYHDPETHIFPMFDFTHSTRLRKLHVSANKPHTYAFLLALLKNMTRTQSNTLQDLSLSGFVMPTNWFQRYKILVDLAAVDTILQHPFFSSLQRITFGEFNCTFYGSEVTNQRLAGKTTFEHPDDDSLAAKQLSWTIERLKAGFEGSGKAGIVVPVVNVCYLGPVIGRGRCSCVDYDYTPQGYDCSDSDNSPDD